jgi:DNA polymerase-3 subunit epsilon
VVFDTETTGLDRWAEIIKLGVVASDGTVLLDTLVQQKHPERKIPEGATAVHGITREALARSGAPTWPEVHDRLIGLLSGRTVVAYNADFDERLLLQTAERHELDVPAIAWQCAMNRYADFTGRMTKLPGGTHDAIGDCRAVLTLLREMGAAAPPPKPRAARRAAPAVASVTKVPAARWPVEASPPPAPPKRPWWKFW